MLKKPKALALTFATIFAAGCAHSNQNALLGPVNWKSGKAPDYSRAKLAPEPKILPQTYFAAGQLLEQEGKLAQAAVQYRKAAAVNHKFTAAYHQLGVVLTKMGEFDGATQALTKAAKMAPKNALIRNNLGFAFMLQKRWPDAAEQFQRCIALHPDFSRAHINLGMTLAKMNRFDDAYDSFRVVLAEPDAHYNLGLMYRASGRLADAAGAFRNALAANPEFYAASAQLQNVESSALATNMTTGEKIKPIRLNMPKAPRQTGTEMQAINTKPAKIASPTPRLINEQEEVNETPIPEPTRQSIGSMQPVTNDKPVRQTRPAQEKITPRPARKVQKNEGISMEPVTTRKATTVPARKPVPRIRPLAEIRAAEHATASVETSPAPTNPQVAKKASPSLTTMDPAVKSATVASTTPRVDPAALPQPDRNPEYTIIEGDKPQKSEVAEATPTIATMTRVDSSTAPQTRVSTPRNAPATRTTMTSMVAVTTSTRQDPLVDTEHDGYTENHTWGDCLPDGRNLCEVLSSGMPVMMTLGTLCPADYANEVATRALSQAAGAREDHMPVADSELIINAFERHIYTFGDDELCWDEIDWQAWEVIDPETVAARLKTAQWEMASPAPARESRKPDQISAAPRTIGTATLITESWVEPSNLKETTNSVRGDSMKVVEMERVHHGGAAENPATIEALRIELNRIRDDIKCLDSEVTTSERAQASHKTSQTRIIPAIDIEAEMNPAAPAIGSSASSELTADQPTILDRSQMDVPTLIPETKPNRAVELSTNSVTMEPVRIHDPAGELPVLVKETPVVPNRAKLIAEVEGAPTINWKTSNASTKNVLTVKMEGTGGTVKKAGTKMGTMQPIEPTRSTLSSTIDEPNAK